MAGKEEGTDLKISLYLYFSVRDLFFRGKKS